MKTKFLLLATFLFVGLGIQASTFETENSSKNNYYIDDYGNSFTFVERDVTFAVFPNGEFDFYINQRNALGVNYQGNGVNISFNSGYDYDPYVQYDDYGAIIQIEDIPIYYDYYGRVTRIGNTDINYDSGRLVRIGGLHVYYNRQGYYSHYSGYINNYNRNYVFHPYHNYFARPLFDFRIVSYNPYRNHYHPTRYTYYSDHSRNKYYDKNYKRKGNDTRRVATKSVPNRYNDKNSHTERRNTTNRTGQINRNNSSVNNTDRRTTTVNRPNSNTRTSQAGNNTDRRANTVNRPSSNTRTSQTGNNTDRRTNTVNRPSSNNRTSQNTRSNGSVNNTDRKSNTVTRSSENRAQSNTRNSRIAENRAPVRTAQKPERTQQRNSSSNSRKGQTVRETTNKKSNEKSDKKGNSRGNSSRRN